MATFEVATFVSSRNRRNLEGLRVLVHKRAPKMAETSTLATFVVGSSMTVRVEVELNGVQVPLLFNDEAVAAIAAAWRDSRPSEPPTPYMTIPEAAELLRCKRQRVDDLLSAGKLTRHKDGARTLVERAELLAHLNGGGR